jgi:uncharacterized protein (TIGR02147 family)
VTDFKQLLQNELVKRCKANPGYSLRAFARSLRVEPSSLSQIINGKRPLTHKMKLRLGASLGLSVHDLERIPTTNGASARGKKQKELPRLSLDTFAVISEWYHYAILELTYLADFKPDAAWVSRRLGITKSEARIAVERLFTLGLLEKSKDGKWKDTSADGELSHLHPSLSTDAARQYQIQLLKLSQASVERDDLKVRNHTSATFCFDPEDLPRAIEALTEFRRKFAREFQPQRAKQKAAKEVYQLQISFFPLTR